MTNTKKTNNRKSLAGKTKKTESLPIITGNIKLCNIRGARRLLSRLIIGFINKKIDGSDAKTLTYLLSQYVSITRDTSIEERLTELESIMEKGK